MLSNADYGLTPEQLDDRYSPEGDGEHPTFSRWDWRQDVASGSTISGYWTWVAHQIAMTVEDLNTEVTHA